jgi:acetyl-CoA C-acetyltransferase
MENVSIVGVGQTPVGEHWDLSLRHLGLQAMQAALADAALEEVDAIIVGNALGGVVSNQNHLGALLADFAGLRGVEAIRVEAADASGGLALHQGYLMVASGLVQTVMVLGVEKVTDVVGSERNTALATFLDTDYEAANGATPVGMAALIMRRYMHEYGVRLSEFANFSVNAHANGAKNEYAMFRNLIKADRFAGAPLVAEPINLFDVAPEADGAAAVILTRTERAADMVPLPVRILASAVATDTLAVHDRPDPLFLAAANISAGRAYEQASITPRDIDVLELHDVATVITALSLEAIGFAERGEGWRLAAENKIGLAGQLPISTFGGLKSRGNPLGATGVYQAVEAALQLRGQAGANQVVNAEIAMTQNLGGIGSTAVTHLFGK